MQSAPNPSETSATQEHGAPEVKTPARLLVTGASGFVGHYVMEAFAQARQPGGRVVGLGRNAMSDVPDGTEFHRVDLLDAAALGRLVSELEPTHVLHLAALSSVREASGSRAETWRANVLGLLNLCEAVATSAAGSVFAFASSGEVYGRAFLSGSPVTEDVDPQPANSYALTKRAGEQMLADILPASDVKTIILRPFNHFGPGQDDRFVAASFATQIARIENGLAAPVLEVGDLSARRDFLDVRDVVSAYRAVIEQAADLPSGSVFNISSGRARPVSDILDGLKALARVPFEVRVAQDRLRPSEIPTASGDASALSRAAAWAPRIPWEDTLRSLLDDARSRNAVDGGAGSPDLARANRRRLT